MPLPSDGTVLAIPLALAAAGPFRSDFSVCVRERPSHVDSIDFSHCPAAWPPQGAGDRRGPRARPGVRRRRTGTGHHQGRRPAFAFRHHGHQRDHAERHHPVSDRRAEQEGRRDGQGFREADRSTCWRAGRSFPRTTAAASTVKRPYPTALSQWHTQAASAGRSR